jgi:hypothetical protein
MTIQEIIWQEFLEDMHSLTNEQILEILGANRLEMIINLKKEELQLKLKTIWRNRKWYCHNDTGEQFDNDTMLYFFNPKLIKKYSLEMMESILDNIDSETIYSNPKTTK